MITLADRALRGCFTPLITPFSDGRIDHETFARLVARQAESGAEGVVVTGTTGEPTSLTVTERTELYEVAVTAAAGRLQVVAATGSPNWSETVALTEAADRAGVDAILVVAPAFVRPSAEGLARHFLAVAERTERPMLIYNIPGRAAVTVAAETILRVADAAENLVGVKHASVDLDPITELLLALGSEFRVFCGLESLSYPMLALGAAGLMNAVANLLPTRVVALCDAAADGDHTTALTIHRELFELNRAVFFDTNPVPLKYMMARMGISSAEVRPPLIELDGPTCARVDGALRTVVGSPDVPADSINEAAVVFAATSEEVK